METIAWVEGEVRFCDQTRLPHEELSIVTRDFRRVAEAIKRLEIRGAPAIGVAAAYGAALSIAPSLPATPAGRRTELEAALSLLGSTRPTAVNLFRAIERIRRVADSTPSDELLFDAVLREAAAVNDEEVAACAAMAAHGVRLISPGSSLLTHCNTGPLATVGGGTALGVIIEAHRQGRIARVFVDETRPLLQGARLTMWELQKAGVDAVLITDSTAGTVMQRGLVRGVFVGADRIAANGDTANKVGTYPLAVLARYHGIPFTVVAPTSTIDPGTPSGAEIPVEERGTDEITHLAGVRIAPAGSRAFAPAFDVTPNELISAIVTERGVMLPPLAPSIARGLRTGEEAR